MIINSTSRGIFVRSRNEDNEVSQETIPYGEFKPYFFVLEDAPELMILPCSDSNGRFDLRISYDATGDWQNLEKKPLKIITWSPSKPEFGRTIRNYYENHNHPTYEADVPTHFRYAVDEIHEMPVFNMRKWYWDMEWMQGGEHDGAITCIVKYDSYDKACSTYVWYPADSDIIMIGGDDGQGNDVNVFDSEKKMLQRFLRDVVHTDPDMLISWFGWKFDLPKLITRLLHHNLDAQLLSPCDEVTGVYWDSKSKKIVMNKNKVNNYSPVYQPIKGRICVPLDMAFERQWLDSQRGTLPSMALDYISETVLGKKKLVSEKFPDKNEFFARAWLEDAETYLDYARIDVELLVELDNTNYITEAILSLQRLLNAPFDACFHASKMGSIYFMKNAPWKAPTGQRGERRAYDGAMVYDPLSEATNGLHWGVAAFDFAGLYPSMIISRNISWETVSLSETELKVNVKTPKDFSEEVDFDYRYFKTDELGLLPKSLLHLKDLRAEYKQNMKKADSKEEYAKWNNNQLAVKRLMASFYGIIAYQGFGWADVRLAECITASAREAIRSAAFLVRDYGEA